MSLSEFDIIARYFNQPGLIPEPGVESSRIPLAIGDDGALITVPPGSHLAVSMDVLLAGVHFPQTAKPDRIAGRALAVNLSDLAAMGAEPVGFTLGLTLPEANEAWLNDFSSGLVEQARRFSCPLIGGNISKGDLSIAIQVHGYVPIGLELRRSGAQAGDRVYVTGTVGDAALGLRLVTARLDPDDLTQDEFSFLEKAYYLPEPRVAAGLGLRGLATAAIDISDGLLADLEHVAQASQAGIKIDGNSIPLSDVTQKLLGREGALELGLSGGDDYELAFTLPANQTEELERIEAECGVRFTCIGRVTPGNGVTVMNNDNPAANVATGYKHF